MEKISSILRKNKKSNEGATSTSSTQLHSVQLKIEKVGEKIEELAKIIGEKEVMVQGHKPDQVIDLNQKIDETQEQMTQVITQIDQKSLITKTTKTEDALKELRLIKKTFDNQRSKIQTFN